MTEAASDEARGTAEALAGFLLRLRSRGRRDPALFRAIERAPRELFLPETLHARAYASHALPLPCGQEATRIDIVVEMVERLGVLPSMRVLEIGSGSGYQAALIAGLAAETVTVERYRGLADAAREALLRTQSRGVSVLHADGLAVVESWGRFDRIVVNAAIDSLPVGWLGLLRPQGRIVLPLARSGRQDVVTLDAGGNELAATAVAAPFGRLQAGVSGL